MNIASTIRLMVVMLAVCLISQPVFAQNVFWSEDFANGAPVGWTLTNPVDTTVWEYETDSGRATVIFNGVPFQSTSVANGFMIFDSDGYGQLQTNHDGRLTTSAINCTGQPTVFLTFENQFVQFAATTAQVGVSTDNVNFTYYTVFANAATQTNGLSVANQTEELDISAVAGNQATVYLQFRWQGNYEYAWKLDDLKLQDGSSIPVTFNTDLELGDFFYTPNNYGTPLTQVVSDTLDGFAVDVFNVGDVDATNVIATVEVLDAATLQISYFSDTVQMGTIEKDSAYTANFSETFLQDQLLLGDYAVVYSIESDSTDVDPSNDIVGEFFSLTDSTYRKDIQIQTGVRAGITTDYTMGNVYTTADNFNTGDFLVSTAEICFTAGAAGTSPEGESVTIWLAEVSSSVAADYSNFTTGDPINSNPDLTVVGFSTFTFPAGSPNYTVYPVNLEELSTGAMGVPLKPSTRYMLVVEASGTAAALYHAVDRTINMFQISTVVYTSQWFLGGFGSDYNSVARMNIRTPQISTNQVELKNATLDVFPNPAQTYATVDLALENPADAVLTVSDVAGRVIYLENLNNVSNERLTVDVSEYAAGTYFVKVTTKEGIKTQRLVVTH